MVEPFKIAVSDEVLQDLQLRLDQTRWPDQVGAPWVYGTDSSYLKDLVDYWRKDYDWRTSEGRLNELDHFTTDMDGRQLHFIHQRSSNEQALPLIMTHGWPGSIAEFTRIIPMLTEPQNFGGKPEDAFHLICPSIPGYGFSSPPTNPGFDQEQVARGHIRLMEELGYNRYVAQGGDWGSPITSWPGVLAPGGVAAIHLTLVFAGFPKGKDDPFAGVTVDEKQRLDSSRAHMKDGTGYQAIQGTRPQTLGFGLNDSPAGLAAWITEKFESWTHHEGNFETAVNRDELLTNIMIYWVTQSITSSCRLYYESAHATNDLFANGKIMTPTGCAIFPGELYQPPRAWAEALYNIQHWSTPAAGGHFAALEQPELLASDLRDFFRAYR